MERALRNNLSEIF